MLLFILELLQQLCYIQIGDIMRNIIKIIIGLMILSVCIFCYSRDRLFELTFISNTFCGLVYIFDGILSIVRKGRGLSAFIWHIALSLHLPVFICVFLGFPVGGIFFFLHFLNPIILFWIYLLCASCDVSKKKTRLFCIFAAPVSFLVYALFDLIRYYMTGEFVYGLLKPSQLNAATIIFIAVYLYSTILLTNFIMIKIKQKQQLSYTRRMNMKQNKKPENGS